MEVRGSRGGTGSGKEEKKASSGGGDVLRLGGKEGDKRWWVDFASRLKDPADTRMATCVAGILCFVDAILCAIIVRRVPYTEIDWEAYMSQVRGFLGGERDYSQMKGDTGPLVYPAGFLYVFSFFKYLTRGSILPAQLCFALLYIVNLVVVFSIYIRSGVLPPWAFFLLCLSKRVHSIFLLRMFNDGVAMAVAYLSISCLLSRRWILALIVFSAGVSVKMNLLLFAPPLLLILLKATSVTVTVVALTCAALVQIVLGLPFLVPYPWEYLSRAFNFGRVFIHFWSVNFKFVREDIFLSKPFALALLMSHLLLLFVFADRRWLRDEGGVWRFLKTRLIRNPLLSKESLFLDDDDKRRGSRKRIDVDVNKKVNKKESSEGETAWRENGVDRSSSSTEVSQKDMVTVMFTGNFIGIVCARSLHYQFYSWYAHTIPFLLWCTPYPTPCRLLLWAAIEYCWNVFPSTSSSSLLLIGCHVLILIGIWRASRKHPKDD